MQRVTRTRRFMVGLAALCMAIAGLITANLAQADSVWIQAYERSSETEECTAQPWETPWQASWGPNSSWSPSWEQWANNGAGGWTCTRSIVWARSQSSAPTYQLGDIGPGGGLVFLISGGLTYEMAPKTWSGGTEDPGSDWCNVPEAFDARGTAIGTGSANTTAMVAVCASGAGNSARAYRGGGFDDWFLPSRDELNALYTYPLSDDRVAAFGFNADPYWTSSIMPPFDLIAFQNFGTGIQQTTGSNSVLLLRPIRAF